MRRRIPTHARLTEQAVRTIRENRHGLTMAAQSLIYGVSKRCIERVRYYETWRWVV